MLSSMCRDGIPRDDSFACPTSWKILKAPRTARTLTVSSLARIQNLIQIDSVANLQATSSQTDLAAVLPAYMAPFNTDITIFFQN